MKFNSLKILVIVVIIYFSTNNLKAVPLPIPPNIAIQDILKHGKRAFEKNKEDKENQEEYKKTQDELEKNISNGDSAVINHKNELRKRFNGNWTGGLVFKDSNSLDISCKIKISIKDFEGKLNSNCKNVQYTIYLFVNLDRNLENSFILTSIGKEKIKLYGDVTSFLGRNKNLNVKGSLEKY
jgi:hypothetical protein|tara:strand:- start:546 stop:1091 length:546 start_codon:yes stop_codon:yes gene_type:complete